MRRVIAIFGAVLMVIAFIILTIFIIAPAAIMPLDNAPLLKGILQTAICQPNEELIAGYSTFSIPGETSTNIEFNCVDSQHNARDVSQQFIQIGGIGYIVLFLIGLFTFLSAMRGSDQRTGVPAAAKASQQSSGASATVIPSGQAQFRTQAEPDHLPLAQRLQELKDALNARLITEAEYQSKRRELLDES